MLSFSWVNLNSAQAGLPAYSKLSGCDTDKIIVQNSLPMSYTAQALIYFADSG